MAMGCVNNCRIGMNGFMQDTYGNLEKVTLDSLLPRLALHRSGLVLCEKCILFDVHEKFVGATSLPFAAPSSK